MYDTPFDRVFLQLSNGIRHVMPSTDRKLELQANDIDVSIVSQPAVCSSGLRGEFGFRQGAKKKTNSFMNHIEKQKSIMNSLMKCFSHKRHFNH